MAPIEAAVKKKKSFHVHLGISTKQMYVIMYFSILSLTRPKCESKATNSDMITVSAPSVFFILVDLCWRLMHRILPNKRDYLSYHEVRHAIV